MTAPGWQRDRDFMRNDLLVIEDDHVHLSIVPQAPAGFGEAASHARAAGW